MLVRFLHTEISVYLAICSLIRMMGAKGTSAYQRDERTNLDHSNKCQHFRVELEIISIIAKFEQNCEINMWNGFNLILIANLIYFSIRLNFRRMLQIMQRNILLVFVCNTKGSLFV